MAVGRGDLGPPPFGLAASSGRGPGGEEGRPRGRVDLAELRRAVGALHVGGAVVLAVGQADPHIQLEGNGQVLAQGRAHGPAVDAAEDLAGQVAQGDRVIAAGGSGGPQRRHGRQLGADGVPVEPQGRLHGIGEAREPGLVAHHLLDGDLALAALRELRPDAGDGLAVVELSGIHQPGDQQGRDGLGAGEDGGQRRLIEGPRALTVGISAPEVDDGLSAVDEGEARAQFLTALEIGLEGRAHRGEGRRAGSEDFGSAQISRSMRTVGEAAFRRWAMATMGSSAAFQIWAALMVSATPPTARARA